MGQANKTRTKAAESEDERRVMTEQSSKDKLLDLMDVMIRRIHEELGKKNSKESVHSLAGDLLKLLAWQKDLGPEEVKEVTVRWIGNGQESPAKD